MVKTPTYHIFHMYKYHQDADLVASYLSGNSEVGPEDAKVPKLSESVSVSADGTINVTVGNLSTKEDEDIELLLTEKNAGNVSASILSGAPSDHNTFDDPEKVTEKELKDITTDGRSIKFTLPKNSVALIRIK